MRYDKKYVTMNIRVNEDGTKRPISLIWEDGTTYHIDRIKFITPAASLKVGGRGMRYTVVMNGQERYLFDEDGRWFVEVEGQPTY